MSAVFPSERRIDRRFTAHPAASVEPCARAEDELRALLAEKGLRHSPLRMMVLEMADEIGECRMDGPAVLKRLYEQGQLVPMSSLYRVLNEFDRLGLIRRSSGRGWPRVFAPQADAAAGALRA